MANGIVIWEGASVIDGAPIFVVATGIKASSRNAKTGNLIQTWILRRDVKPTDAVNTGADRSICGDCPHRGDIVNGKNVNRSCYVTVFQAPLSVWKTATAGKYPVMSIEESRALFAGRHVRLGAYGDPAAVPFGVWESVLTEAARGTGYTHQWQTCSPEFARYCMASADSPCEAIAAQAMGYRTFRVGTFAESAVKGEFLCPASEQAGKKLNCAACLACGGTEAPNKAHVFIPVHGARTKISAHERRTGNAA